MLVFYIFGPVALLLAAMFYVPAWLMAALARPLLGIKAEDKARVDELNKTCLVLWLIALTALLALTK
jgi:hypothetical protein